jgi:hypothetical protein
MVKVGVDDQLAAHGPAILPELLANAWAFDGQPCPVQVHLSDIEDADLGRRRIATDVMVSAVGDVFLLPKEVVLRCVPLSKSEAKKRLHLRLVRDEEGDDGEDTADESDAFSCEHCEREDGYWNYEIDKPETLIELTKTAAAPRDKRLQTIASRACPNAYYVETRTHQTVTVFLGTPKAQRVRSVEVNGARIVQDEHGKPYREKVLYFLGRLDQSSRTYRAVGTALPNPKSQEATAFFWQLIALEDEFESFAVTPTIRSALNRLQAVTGGVRDKLKSIAHDVTLHLTRIYGEHRERALLGKLLVFHSVRQFAFDGETLKRGWLEMLEIGDTGQGKTQQFDRVSQGTGLGEGIDGVSTSRTGLAYAYHKLADSWFLVWGKYPLNTGKLLFIDEAQNLRPEDIDKIRKGRSEGVIVADGIRPGEHPTQTRLIASCNPRYQGVVDDEMFGIELVKQTFKDEDIRRFDFAIISSSSDGKADINTRRSAREHTNQVITTNVLADSIKWAWSRRPEHVVFTDAAIDGVYATAAVLVSQFGEARDIPLMLESDARHKVARLAVGVAALLHSTDESHERIIVQREHVDAVGDYIVEVYSHPNCSFDQYARIRRSEAALTDDDYDTIWTALRTFKVEGTTTLAEEDLQVLLLSFVNHGGVLGRSDLAGELGKSPAWTSKIVGVLKSEKLIRVNKGKAGGYRATPRFTKFLKRAVAKKDLEG